tara:strand:+ start:78816 stop:79334 length:519 start_codon:yes stop_codon:yes gene_type:complete
VQRHANQYLRDENIFKKRVSIFFSLLKVMNITIFIWTFFYSSDGDILIFIKILSFVMIYYFIKYVCISLLGYLFKKTQIASLTLFFTNLYDKILSLFLFPLLVLSNFFIIEITHLLFPAGLILILGFFILKIYWLSIIGIKSFGLSRFYLFIYICLLEFFPILLIVKRAILI